MFATSYEIIQFIVGLIGSLLTIACFVPQGIKTLKTKDTSGISLIFPIAALCSSVFWITSGVMIICNNNSNLASGLAGGIPIVLTNVVTSCINVVITIIKIKNVKNAKKMNLTEAEYCLQLTNQKQAAAKA